MNTSNIIVESLKKFVGKEFTESPSPLGRWLNPVLLKVEAGALEMSFTVRKEMLNPAQVLHGGITASMADEAMGVTMFSMGYPNFRFTLNLNIDYFAPARVGDKVLVKTQIIKDGKQVTNMQCELFHADGKRIARAYSNLLASNVKFPIPPSATS